MFFSLYLFSTKKKEVAPTSQPSTSSKLTLLKPIADSSSSEKQFPTGNPKVYHFHPIAFVEQMMRLGGGCFCNRELTVQEVENIVRQMRESENRNQRNYFLLKIARSLKMTNHITYSQASLIK